MAHTLHEWLADPLFAAAEDVQESADRLESNFRTWKQETQDQTKFEAVESLRLRLVSACDTLKWQLEVFERAVRSEGSLEVNFTLDASARKRRQEFIDIIRLQLCAIEVQVRGKEQADCDLWRSRQAPPPDFRTPSASFSQQSLTAAFSPEVLLPGEKQIRDIKTDLLSISTGSPASGLSGFFGSGSHGSDSNSFLSSSSLSTLSGFLGVSSPRAFSRSASTLSSTGPGPSILSQESSQLSPQHPEADVEEAGAEERRCYSSECLQAVCEEAGMQSQSTHMGGPGSPGPECKSFPSLAHMRGAQHGLHGWQCIFVWMQHFNRVSRRRMLENKGSEEDLTLGPAAPNDSSHGVAVSSSRLEAAQVLSVSRTSSAVNLSSLDQTKRAEWHLDMTSAAAALPVEEHGKKAAGAWHLSARPRRLNTMQRPVRPVSSVILVCAVAIVMIAATVYSRYARGQVFDQRHASLLEVPSMQASSPAFP